MSDFRDWINTPAGQQMQSDLGRYIKHEFDLRFVINVTENYELMDILRKCFDAGGSKDAA